MDKMTVLISIGLFCLQELLVNGDQHAHDVLVTTPSSHRKLKPNKPSIRISKHVIHFDEPAENMVEDELIERLLPYSATENTDTLERSDVSEWGKDLKRLRARRIRSTVLSQDRLKENIPKGKTFPFVLAPTWAPAYPWPKPWTFISDASEVFVIDPRRFHFVIGVSSQSCDTLSEALKRYYKIITGHNVSPDSILHQSEDGYVPQVELIAGDWFLRAVEITVHGYCNDGFPGYDSNETYSIEISRQTANIHAGEVWGVLRGLETLRQIIYTSDSGKLSVNKSQVTDHPRFGHRGILLDTGRHFLSPAVIKKNLDAMEMNKLNVFHWHMVDDQSFPFQSKSFPSLTIKGAFSPGEVYTHEDIRGIVEYARQRGIRVIPEIDTPGHTTSWGHGIPDIAIKCPEELHLSLLDPVNNATYSVLQKLFTEVMDMFPETNLHLGGDEVSTACWANNAKLTHFMKSENLTSFPDVVNHYINRLTNTLHNLDSTRRFMFWQDVMDSDRSLPPGSIIQIWQPRPKKAMKSAFWRGHEIVFSTPWYLNLISYGRDWLNFYLAEPFQQIENSSYWSLVHGGEACMWGEYVDDSNLLPTLWPRASAVAERLWSSPNTRNVSEAIPRLEEHRCRMIREGIPAGPVDGSSSCFRR